MYLLYGVSSVMKSVVVIFQTFRVFFNNKKTDKRSHVARTYTYIDYHIKCLVNKHDKNNRNEIKY